MNQCDVDIKPNMWGRRLNERQNVCHQEGNIQIQNKWNGMEFSV